MNKRHRQILDAFEALGGEASLKQIANETGFNVNGISQSMGTKALKDLFQDLGGKGGWRRYRLKEPKIVQLSLFPGI